MARRGENIRKRKDGRWEGRYIKARTPEGKIQWGYVYGTVYVEVKRVLIQRKAEAGFYNLNRTDLTFEALAEVWLYSLKNAIKESTYAHYSYTLHKYLLPVLSKAPVASLEESFLDQHAFDLCIDRSVDVAPLDFAFRCTRFDIAAFPPAILAFAYIFSPSCHFCFLLRLGHPSDHLFCSHAFSSGFFMRNWALCKKLPLLRSFFEGHVGYIYIIFY